MTATIDYQTFEVPARVADLEFSIRLPSHWVAPELPPANDDFSDPTMFLPLTVRLMPMSSVIFAVAARPAYENGTIHDWVPYLMESQRFAVSTLRRETVNGLEIIVGTASKNDPEEGPRFLHFAFFEDGGRLVNLFLTGPAEVESSLAQVWQDVFPTFALARPKGQRAHPPMPAVQ